MDYDLVLEGQRLEMPNYVDEWKCELLNWCWKLDPEARPKFGEILKFLEANSAAAENTRRRDMDHIAAQKKRVLGTE